MAQKYGIPFYEQSPRNSLGIPDISSDSFEPKEVDNGTAAVVCRVDLGDI